ncbi:CHAT domain-containing protein [Winogradskyella sp. SM1960]|uniref:CHAT domain-containing protein n=1 Tax=Winogradskyella sp. SM1960 TaxID=2865955 RepID=UPI001CD571D6|nr:CHAT domain-containing tetratricopeptide repeat protein [Winogradskyella sp. SM1960]
MKTKLSLLLIGLFTQSLFAFQNTTSHTTLKKVDSLVSEKAYKQAYEVIEELQQKTPKINELFHLIQSKQFYCKGLLEEEQEKYAKAIVLYQQAQDALGTYETSAEDTYKVTLFSRIYHSLAYSGNWQAALEKGTEGLAFMNTRVDKEVQADYIYDLGYINDRLKNYTDAIDLYQQSIASYKTFEADKNFDLGLAYNNLATVYKHIGFFSERLKSYEKAKEYWEKDRDIDPSYLITLYGNMMKMYIEYGDASKAEALFSTLNKLPNTKRQVANRVSKFRLSVIYYTFSEQLTKAEQQLAQFTSFFSALSAKEKQQFSHHYLATLIELGDAYVLEKLDQNANVTLQRALQISQKYQQPYYEMLTNSSLAKLATQNKQYKAAITYLDKSLDINNTTPIGMVNVVNILIKKGNLQVQLNQLQEANKTIRKALTVLAKKEVNSVEDITIEIFEQHHSSFFVMAVKNSAAFYKEMFYKTQQEADAQQAKYLYELAAEVFGLYYQNGEYNTNLNFYNKAINEGIYEMHQALKIPLSGTILAKIEGNNSQVLRNEFERKHFQFIAVEDSLLDQHNLLKFQLENFQENKTEKTTPQELQDAIAKIDATLAAEHPFLQSFYKEEIRLKKVQNHLSEDELLIKYFLGFEFAYAIGISKNGVQLFQLSETDTLKAKLDKFNRALQNPQKNTVSQARELYSQLIQPLEDEVARYKTLTIIPDDVLHYLPFEVLENKTALLLNSHKIQYANSLALWYFLKTNPNQSKGDKNLLVAFAPQYESNNNDQVNLRDHRFKEIQGARNEAKNISATFEGDLFLDDKASIDNFMNHTNAYKIYHLAMHAVLNENEHTKSSLVFHNNDFFNFSALYNMYFPAELVVLSACNTGVGKLSNGEGLLSLSRALTYSGVRSSVYSLWAVPDEETSEIMVSFYHYLKGGKDKTKALAYAKRDFMQNNPMKSHPYYWAGFVVNGDTLPVVTGNDNWIKYMLLATGLILGLAAFFYRRHKQREASI